MKHFLVFVPLLVVIIQYCNMNLVDAQAAAGPAPAGPTNITKILEKAGQFTTLIRLFKTTQIGDQINTQLNSSNQGLTIFAPTDNAFAGLKPGTLNSLTDQEKVELIQFHVLPSYYTMSQFETASNPLRTQAGDSAGAFPLNVTTSGNNQVNVSTGVVNAPVDNTIYTDGQLAVYAVNKVLLPVSLFGTPAPAAAPAPAKSKKKTKVADSPVSGEDAAQKDSSGVADVVHGAVAAVAALIAVFVL